MTLYQRTVEILRNGGIRPKKKLSQNFLVDDGIFQQIVTSVSACGDQYFEIGSGLGFLTEALAESGKRVVALELDSPLVQAAQQRLREKKNVTLIQENILEFHPENILLEKQWIAVGNLPYHISGSAIRWLLDHRSPFTHFFLMLQKEVAERVTAKPGGKIYGVLSLLCQHFTNAEILFSIPSQAFYPPPKVESAFLKFQVKSNEPPENPLLIPLIKQAFRERRKTIFNNLKSWQFTPGAWGIYLDQAGIPPKERAENLPLETFQKLAKILMELGDMPRHVPKGKREENF